MPTIAAKIEEKEIPAASEDNAFYRLTDKEKVIVEKVSQLFRVSQDQRDASLEYFDGRNLLTYIEDSVRRFITNVDEREDIEDWQARIHAPFTRNKVLAILGKVVDALPMIEFIPRGDEDLLKAEILSTLFEYADDIDDVEEFFTYTIEEAIVKGTAVGYEGFDVKEKDIREVKKYNGGDGIKTVKSKLIQRRISSKIVPLEEFYPSSIGTRNIKDMPYCFWRKLLTYDSFLKDFSNYKKAKNVQPYSTTLGKEVDRPFYWDYIGTGINDGEVEIIKYYNQETDEFIIIANGIWLNPVEGEEVSPIPFNHKSLPFWAIRYDIFGSDIFYGKSLPDRLKSLQDVLNVLQNMLLDQSFLTIFPPILVSGVDDIEDDFLRPGRRITVDTQGLPINQAYQKLDLGTPTGWHQFILQYTKRILEESSVDSVQQGVVGTGSERTTATEVRSAASGVVSLLGLFAKFIKYGVRERARLRASNIIQFYTDPENPILEQVLGEGGKKKVGQAFNTIEVDSSPLTPGQRGVKIVEMFAEKSELPTQRALRIRTAVDEKVTGKKMERIAITPEYLREFEFDIKLVANPKNPASRELDKALEIQFQQTILALHGDLVDRKELAAELITKFDRDPRKILKEEVFAPPLQPQQETAVGTMPGGGDNKSNTIKGGTGVGDEQRLMQEMMSG